MTFSKISLHSIKVLFDKFAFNHWFISITSNFKGFLRKSTCGKCSKISEHFSSEFVILETDMGRITFESNALN